MGNRTTCALSVALLVGCVRAGDATHAARNARCGNDARYLAPDGDALAVRSHAQVTALTREYRAALRCPPDSPCRPVVTTVSTMSLHTDAGLLEAPVFEHTLVLDGPDLAANCVVS